jgi:hypothetical protein
METHPFRQRTLRSITGVALLALVGFAPLVAAESTRNLDLEFIYHDGIPAWDIFLYPFDNGAVGSFVFPIDNQGWEWIEFTKIKFYHEAEIGRPFRILLIRRDLNDGEYRIVDQTSERETTCTECWEEVIMNFQETLVLGSYERCHGLFLNIVPDDDIPLDDTFSLWADATVDYAYSSAWFWDVNEDPWGNLEEPWYNSEEGWGEYLIDIYATLRGITATGETTFSEIKLMYGDR